MIYSKYSESMSSDTQKEKTRRNKLLPLWELTQLEVPSKITQVIKVLGVKLKEPLTMTTTDKC